MAELNELTINGSNYTFEDDVARGLATAEANRAQEAEQSLQTAINNKVDKVTGKSLSTNDYTNAEKAKLAELENYDDTRVRQLINEEKAARQQGDNALSESITQEETRAKGAEQTLQLAIDIINGKIPVQATTQNQLADKEFVNSSISTATADFKGTYNSLQELEQVTANVNDYAFVIATDAVGNTVYKRYKWVEGTGWSFEYDLNNSSFTAAQWAAIQSGITAALVTKLTDLPTNAELNQRISTAITTALEQYYTKSELDEALGNKQDIISDLTDIRSGAQAGSTAYQKPQGGIPSTDMSQDVQTSLKKANTALQEHQSLDAYAKNDGYYEGMGVGTADNLTGQTERTNDAMYRKSGGSEEVASGTATISNIKGQTVAWNQLVDTDTVEVTPVNGRKICTVINGVKSIVTSDGSAIAVSSGTDMVFDLTLIYGAGNEPTTVEQFEADYKRWFGKPLDYEPYDTGSLISVQLDSLKTTGFNQYNNSQARVIGGLQYQITGTYTTITLNDETITPDANGLFTPSTTGTLIITGGGNNTCIHISGDRNGEYEPYEEHYVVLPVTTITGKLDGEGESVVVFPDGMKKLISHRTYPYNKYVNDTIKIEGDKCRATKYVGSVDLSTLNWRMLSSGTFSSKISDRLFTTRRAIRPNGICGRYEVLVMGQEVTSNCIVMVSDGASAANQKNITIYDESFSDVASLISALQGVMFYYELETPEVYELDTFDLPKPYQVDGDGTEEQIQKSGVQGLAAILTCIYGVDAVKILDKLPQNYISEASMDNFLAQLNTVTGGTWTKTWNDNTGKWDFSFQSSQVEPTNNQEEA